MLFSVGPRWLNLSGMVGLDRAQPTARRATCPVVWHGMARLWLFGRELVGPSWWLELPAWRAKQ